MNKDIINAEFYVVHERTLETIAAEIRTIDSHIYQVALSGAIEIGKRLEEAKSKVAHGEWENWCKENLNYSRAWASKLMKIAEEYGKENSPYLSAVSNVNTCAHLSISNALRLLQVPEKEVETFVERVDISDITTKELEEEIKALKAEKEEALRKAIMTESDLRMANESLEEANAEKERSEEEIKKLLLNMKELESRMNEDATSESDAELIAEIESLKEKLTEEESNREAIEKRIASEIEKATAEEKARGEQRLAEELKKAEEVAANDLAKARAEIEKAREEKEQAEKKAKSLSQEDVAVFKVKVEDLQIKFNEIVALIEKKKADDEETATKWTNALKTVMTGQVGRL